MELRADIQPTGLLSSRSPLVSVVMTLYNDGAFVCEAVESILSQTFTDFELVVVDDGGIDDGVEKLLTFRDSRIRLIRQANTGIAGALNHGIREARGEFIARQDADDVSDPRRLERQVAFLRAHPEVGLVGTAVRIIDEAGMLLSEKRYDEDNASLQRELLSGNPFIHGSVLFRKAIALDLGLYRTQFRCEDFDLWLRMAEVTQVANLREPLYSWRRRHSAVGVSNRRLITDATRLAIWCARERRCGRPEPELKVEEVTRQWFVRLTRGIRGVEDPDVAYDLINAQDLILQGRGTEARSILRSVIRRKPLVLYAWLLLALTILPGRAATSLWHRLRSIYRVGTWRR